MRKDKLISASIIILTRNGLVHTKECISSIQQCTKENYELILIDNGSADGTVEFIKSIENAKVIINKHNKGFSGGCNQGMAMAEGEYIVLLNNDTVVTEGWLTRLIWWLRSDESLGIVGPMSNFVLPEQMVTEVSYKTMYEMHDFAIKWTEKHSLKGRETNYLSGFCMIFKKSLLTEIGGLDERFFPGYYEDLDFCIRASIAGKKLWIANDVYIHHYGSSSFKHQRKMHKKAIDESKKTFLKKWKINDFNNIKELVQSEIPFDKEKHFIPFGHCM